MGGRRIRSDIQICGPFVKMRMKRICVISKSVSVCYKYVFLTSGCLLIHILQAHTRWSRQEQDWCFFMRIDVIGSVHDVQYII